MGKIRPWKVPLHGSGALSFVFLFFSNVAVRCGCCDLGKRGRNSAQYRGNASKRRENPGSGSAVHELNGGRRGLALMLHQSVALGTLKALQTMPARQATLPKRVPSAKSLATSRHLRPSISQTSLVYFAVISESVRSFHDSSGTKGSSQAHPDFNAGSCS